MLWKFFCRRGQKSKVWLHKNWHKNKKSTELRVVGASSIFLLLSQFFTLPECGNSSSFLQKHLLYRLHVGAGQSIVTCGDKNDSWLEEKNKSLRRKSVNSTTKFPGTILHNMNYCVFFHHYGMISILFPFADGRFMYKTSCLIVVKSYYSTGCFLWIIWWQNH